MGAPPQRQGGSGPTPKCGRTVTSPAVRKGGKSHFAEESLTAHLSQVIRANASVTRPVGGVRPRGDVTKLYLPRGRAPRPQCNRGEHRTNPNGGVSYRTPARPPRTTTGSPRNGHRGGAHGDVTAECPGTEGHGGSDRVRPLLQGGASEPLVDGTVPPRRAAGVAAGLLARVAEDTARCLHSVSVPERRVYFPKGAHRRPLPSPGRRCWCLRFSALHGPCPLQLWSREGEKTCVCCQGCDCPPHSTAGTSGDTAPGKFIALKPVLAPPESRARESAQPAS